MNREKYFDTIRRGLIYRTLPNGKINYAQLRTDAEELNIDDLDSILSQRTFSRNLEVIAGKSTKTIKDDHLKVMYKLFEHAILVEGDRDGGKIEHPNVVGTIRNVRVDKVWDTILDHKYLTEFVDREPSQLTSIWLTSLGFITLVSDVELDFFKQLKGFKLAPGGFHVCLPRIDKDEIEMFCRAFSSRRCGFKEEAMVYGNLLNRLKIINNNVHRDFDFASFEELSIIRYGSSSFHNGLILLYNHGGGYSFGNNSIETSIYLPGFVNRRRMDIDIWDNRGFGFSEAQFMGERE